MATPQRNENTCSPCHPTKGHFQDPYYAPTALRLGCGLQCSGPGWAGPEGLSPPQGQPTCRHHKCLVLGRPGQGPAHSRRSQGHLLKGRTGPSNQEHPSTEPLTPTEPQRAVAPWGRAGPGAVEHLARERTPGKGQEGSSLQQGSVSHGRGPRGCAQAPRWVAGETKPRQSRRAACGPSAGRRREASTRACGTGAPLRSESQLCSRRPAHPHPSPPRLLGWPSCSISSVSTLPGVWLLFARPGTLRAGLTGPVSLHLLQCPQGQ